MVVGERGCDTERSMDKEDEEQPRGDEERPHKVLETKTEIEKVLDIWLEKNTTIYFIGFTNPLIVCTSVLDA